MEIHRQEIKSAGGADGIRDIELLKSAIGAAQASFDGQLLMGIFDIASTYVNSIAFNHPFLDGNKRTAAATALTFLFLNGYTLEESYEEELADKVLDLVSKKITKKEFSDYLSDNCIGI